MMDDHNDQEKLHFLMFPWLAQGHINPFLELSKAFAVHGHRISFLSTPVNISRIRPSLHLQKWPGRIDLLELPLPPTEGLAPGAECTADIPPEMTFLLSKAMDGMEKSFRSLLGQLRPDYVIHDFLQYWTPSAAAELKIPAIYFSGFSTAFCCQVFHPCRLGNQKITAEELAAPPLGFPSSAITSRPYEATDMLILYRGIPGHMSPMYRLARCLEGCVAVIVKSCFEEEEKYISYLHHAIGVPVLSVGPLTLAVQSGVDSSEGFDLLQWLDRQRAASAIFVLFGTEVVLSGEQNGVAHVQSLPRGNDMGSSSLNVPENIKITETGQEKVAAQRNSGTQYYGMAEISKEKAQSSSLQKKTLRQNSSTQNMSDSIGNYSMILNPPNRQLNSVARDPTATKTVHPESNIHASMNNYLCSRPVVQPSKLHRGLVVSQGNILVNSLDSMRVTSVSNNSVSVNRMAAESEHSQLRNMKEIPQATAQKFVTFTGGVFGHSASMSYCTSSIDPPFTSQRDSLQEASMQSEISQFVNHPCPFGNSMRFTSVTVPQVVSPALFAGQLGEGKTAEGLSYGCITVQDQPNLCNFRSNPSADKPNPCNFQSNPSAVQQPARNSSICPPQKQNGSNQASNNTLFGIENGSYGGNLVVGVPPCAYTAQSDAQVLLSSNSNGRGCTSVSLTTSQLYQGAYRRQHSATNTSHSSGLITTQKLSDTSDVNTIDCCGETALFGNPILRLMGKNLMVANKDGGQPKQLDKVPTSMEEYPNANYLRLLGFTSEENFWQDGNSYLNQPLESSITFDQNNLHASEGLRRRDSRSLGGYCYQPPMAAGNISDVWLRRLSVSPCQSSAGANSVNIGPAGSQLGFTSPTIKYTLSHIPSTSMEKEMSYRPVGANFQAKKKPPSSAGSQSVHEVIIIDDSPDEGPVAPIPILEPTSFSGRSPQSQEGHSTPRISKANSKFRSGNTMLQTAPSCFSALTESSVACGSNLPNAGMYRQN